MRTRLLLPLALAGLLGGCAVYAPDPYQGPVYGPGPGYSQGYSQGWGYGYYSNTPRYYSAPPAIIVQPAPIFIPPRPPGPPGGRRFFDRDRDGVPDRFDRRPNDPRRR